VAALFGTGERVFEICEQGRMRAQMPHQGDHFVLLMAAEANQGSRPKSADRQ
jgi:hypothetical protein